MSQTKVYTFKVEMACNGCLEAVKRSVNKNISKLGGFSITGIHGDLEAQTVAINVSKDGSQEFPGDNEVLEIVKKAGKPASLLT